jgi:hypothetical protein
MRFKDTEDVVRREFDRFGFEMSDSRWERQENSIEGGHTVERGNLTITLLRKAKGILTLSREQVIVALNLAQEVNRNNGRTSADIQLYFTNGYGKTADRKHSISEGGEGSAISFSIPGLVQQALIHSPFRKELETLLAGNH